MSPLVKSQSVRRKSRVIRCCCSGCARRCTRARVASWSGAAPIRRVRLRRKNEGLIVEGESKVYHDKTGKRYAQHA
eukprot:6214837-Pleurochrysis_carterae.AAC.7